MNDRNDMDCREVYGLDEYDAYLDKVDSFEDWSEAMDGDNSIAEITTGKNSEDHAYIYKIIEFYWNMVNKN
jgi:hypothetical protein